jgi:hypothetical protein
MQGKTSLKRDADWSFWKPVQFQFWMIERDWHKSVLETDIFTPLKYHNEQL